jgi:hypothetical protein
MIRYTMMHLTLVLVAAAGCQSTRHASPMITDYDAGDQAAELDFWHGLAEQPIATNNDAMHGLIELAHGSDPHRGYEQRVAWLKSQGLLATSFDRPADEAVTRGTVAQILCHVLEINGGITMRLIGPHPRYAVRELVYLEIMRPGTPQQALSGIQFVGIVGRAQDFDGRIP